MKLIDDCKGAWRHYSTQALAFIATLGGTWHSLPDWVKEQLPGWAGQVVAWIDQTILAFLEHGRDEALHYKRAAVIARRATALAKMTRDPGPIATYKIGERWLIKLLCEFGCRI